VNVPPAPGAFPDLTPEQLEGLREVGTEREIEAGEVLFREGDNGYPFFAIVEGLVAIVDGYGRPEEREIVTHGPGRFVGELNLVTGEPAYLTAVVREPGRVIAVPRENLLRIIAQDPTLSELIMRAFLVRRSVLRSRGVGPRVVGSRHSRETRRLIEFLNRIRFPYVWIDLEEDEAAEALLQHAGVTPAETPVVIVGETVLRNPTIAEVAALVGHVPDRGAADHYDLVVVGTGPAGLAASVYGASEGLSTLALESLAVGGQAGTSMRIENYLGFPAGLSGDELAARAIAQAEKFSARITSPCEAVELRTDGALHVVRLADGDEVAAHAVIIATGAQYRRLDVPRLEDLEGIGVYYAATQAEAQMCAGSVVAVVGGGNSAGQAAVFLSQHVAQVNLLVRRDGLSETMSRYLVDQVERTPNIALSPRTEVRELLGEDRLEGVVVEREGERHTLPARALFVFIGADPHTSWLEGAVELDEHGFVRTGREVSQDEGHQPYFLETSRPGVFAAGDARSGSIKRVASAVGEGSMAVRLVHDHLSRVASAP
jgi:thioredoxin reductase (NADPH)